MVDLSIAMCEMLSIFKIRAINLPPARRALGDHGDADTQNCKISLPPTLHFPEYHLVCTSLVLA